MSKKKELNDQQKAFCDEFLKCQNATQAAIKAGYKKSTARYASRWIKKDESPQKPTAENKSNFNPEMRKYIDERLAEKDKERIASQDEVLEHLTAVMRREKTENVVVTLKNEKSYYEPDEKGKLRKVTIREEVPQIVEIPAKLADANKAAELLGKAHCLFTDRVGLEGSAKVVIVDDIENS